MRVAACLVTRGNVPMEEILESIPADWEIVLWDNTKQPDLGVYGRYQAIELTDAELIYVQDDDAVLETADILELAAWLTVPGMLPPDTLVANMPERFRPHYPDSCLVGFGAIFERHLPRLAFNRLGAAPANFELTCDVYFTAGTASRKLLDLPHRDQPWASDPDRMWKQTNHVPIRAEALALARMLR